MIVIQLVDFVVFVAVATVFDDAVVDRIANRRLSRSIDDSNATHCSREQTSICSQTLQTVVIRALPDASANVAIRSCIACKSLSVSDSFGEADEAEVVADGALNSVGGEETCTVNDDVEINDDELVESADFGAQAQTRLT